MLKIKETYHKFIILFLSLFSVLIIGYIDYKTSSEISFSLFYLIPISLTALNSKNKSFVMFIVLIASIMWLYADMNTKEYSNNYITYWNAFVRLSIFTLVGLLLFKS